MEHRGEQKGHYHGTEMKNRGAIIMEHRGEQKGHYHGTER